jgi:predicted transcriptional regulator
MGAMENMLEALFGNRTAARLMLYLFHYGEAYASGIARDLGTALSPVQRQLDKFETAGLLVSRMVGNTRVYTFNPKQPVTGRLKDLIRFFYEAMSLKEREGMFPTRRRPRRRGKPVLGRKA